MLSSASDVVHQCALISAATLTAIMKIVREVERSSKSRAPSPLVLNQKDVGTRYSLTPMNIELV